MHGDHFDAYFVAGSLVWARSRYETPSLHVRGSVFGGWVAELHIVDSCTLRSHVFVVAACVIVDEV